MIEVKFGTQYSFHKEKKCLLLFKVQVSACKNNVYVLI